MGNILKNEKNETVIGFQENNETILRRVYSETYPKVRNYVLKNNGDEMQSKDIFQEAFIACWKNIKANKLSENGNVEAYLYTIAKNKWIDYLRSTTYRKTVFDNNNLMQQNIGEEPLIDENEEEEEEEEERKILQLALKQLAADCKELLTKFYFERKSMNKISEELKLSTASSRNKKYRCMEKLRYLSLEIKNNG